LCIPGPGCRPFPIPRVSVGLEGSIRLERLDQEVSVKKSRLLWAAALAPLALLAPRSTSQSAADLAIPGLGKIQQEPTLVYDVTGGTLSGLVNTNVVVYNNGLVSYSNFGSFGGGDGSSCVVQVPTDAVKKLTSDLKRSGAATLPDGGLIISDVPLQTVTFLAEPATDAKAHTFSFLGGGQQGQVAQIINQFLQQYVPGCGSSDF
jgi:hypothetical protein